MNLEKVEKVRIKRDGNVGMNLTLQKMIVTSQTPSGGPQFRDANETLESVGVEGPGTDRRGNHFIPVKNFH